MDTAVASFIAEHFPKMAGWCDPKKGAELARLVLATKPQKIAEVGVFEGKSTLALAYACKLNKTGTVYAVDSWTKQDCTDDETTSGQEYWAAMDMDGHYEAFVRHVVRADVVRQIQFCRMSSWDASRFLPDMDMVHIDANHAEWPSTSDVVNWLPKLKIGGYLVMDDVHFESTQTALRFVLKRSELVARYDLAESCFAVYKKLK
jgi:predicted O-methyltransferase YrrM